MYFGESLKFISNKIEHLKINLKYNLLGLNDQQ